MPSSTNERREFILEELARSQIIQVSDLSERLAISEVSIRRDLDWLERSGLLKRVHGGAVAIPNAVAGRSHPARTRNRLAEKERIARAAAELICEGDRLIFDSGSTVLQVARSVSGTLLNSGNLTVITASLGVVRELGRWPGVHLMVLGGIYLPNYDIVVGPQTIDNLKGLHVDRMFIGTDGLTFSHGLTTANVLESEVDQAMVRAASEVIVVADSSKIGVIGLTTIMPLTEIDRLITDTDAPADFVAELREQGVEVVLV
jgi:DeoR/GlpR family transcriptional regulator of sugar metabolism